MPANQSPSASPHRAANDLDFFDALRRVSEGRRITKREWNDAQVWLYLSEDGFLKIHHSDGRDDALLIRDGDLLGTDFYLLEQNVQ